MITRTVHATADPVSVGRQHALAPMRNHFFVECVRVGSRAFVERICRLPENPPVAAEVPDLQRRRWSGARSKPLRTTCDGDSSPLKI